MHFLLLFTYVYPQVANYLLRIKDPQENTQALKSKDDT